MATMQLLIPITLNVFLLPLPPQDFACDHFLYFSMESFLIRLSDCNQPEKGNKSSRAENGISLSPFHFGHRQFVVYKLVAN